ncbi:MAG: hypothetical protein HY376_01965 [Candidatus Blackburnbacteria bacterium]|nr:hypothetical protein [Candidatus Blackburnbacteria bacterium]
MKSTNTIESDQVMSVYSGKNGRCCCGCSGKHYYASTAIEVGSKHRGYPVEPSEVSDRMVRKVVGLINATNPSQVEDLGTCLSIVRGERLYIAYLPPSGSK